MRLIGELKGAIQDNFTNIGTKTGHLYLRFEHTRYVGKFSGILCLFVFIHG